MMSSSLFRTVKATEFNVSSWRMNDKQCTVQVAANSQQVGFIAVMSILMQYTVVRNSLQILFKLAIKDKYPFKTFFSLFLEIMIPLECLLPFMPSSK